MENFVITRFNSTFFAQDPTGRRIEFKNRRYACFIITTKGEIRFTYEGGRVISSPDTPIFLPKGLSYLNECTGAAESFVFNFETLSQEHTPAELSPISSTEAFEYYKKIRTLAESTNPTSRLLLFESLYSLSYRLMRTCAGKDNANPIVAKALEFISQSYGRSEHTVRDAAQYCSVSEVYLRKLFRKELGLSPFEKITELRMNRAKMLIEEKRPLKEIADSVGYSDVFQFSRAYKRYFGHSPSKH